MIASSIFARASDFDPCGPEHHNSPKADRCNVCLRLVSYLHVADVTSVIL